MECALFWSACFVYFPGSPGTKSKTAQSFLTLQSKIEFCCLKSQEKVHLCLGKGQRRGGKGGRISEESQRKSSREPGFSGVPNWEWHCRWGLLLCRFKATVSSAPMLGFWLPNIDFCHPWQCVALGTFVGVFSWACRRSTLDAEVYEWL